MRKVAFLFVLSVVVLPRQSQAVPIQWTTAAGGNGHFYELILNGGSIAWTDAQTAAGGLVHAGLVGHLATITSAAENAFIVSTFANGVLFGPWIGGSDVAAEGQWRWVTGPEAGTLFWTGGPGGATTPPFNFANWADVVGVFDEPNNSFGIEHYAHVLFSSANGLTPGTWNDGQNSGGGNISSYLVEFSASAAVPEPSTWISVGTVLAGVLGYGALSRSRRRRGARIGE